MQEKGDFLFGFDVSGFSKAINSMSSSMGSFQENVSKRVKAIKNEADKTFGTMASSVKDSLIVDQYGNPYKTISPKPADAIKAVESKPADAIKAPKTESMEPTAIEETAVEIKGLTTAMVKALAIFEVIKDTVTRTFEKIRSAIETGIPEISQVFSIMGNIFTKNLLWPLRKELMPYLQKMLDWTKNHRKDFVEWGQVLVNVFRAAKHVAISFFEALRPIFTGVADVLKSVFGNTQASIIETINVAIFKIVMLMDIFALKITPIAAMVGDLIKSIGEQMVRFSSDLPKKMNQGVFMQAFQPFIDVLDSFRAILGMKDNMFVKWADTVSSAVMRMVKLTVGALVHLWQAFAFTSQGIRSMFHPGEAVKLLNEFQKKYVQGIEDLVIRPEPAPVAGRSNYVSEMMANRPGLNPMNVRWEFGPISLNVTEGSAEKAGQNFVRGLLHKHTLYETLREQHLVNGGQ